MGGDVIPDDPYHPHLGYTVLVAALACLSIFLYSRYALKQHPRLRVFLYALAISLPVLGEVMSYFITEWRPAPNTLPGYMLTHFHAQVLNRYPIDSFLSPTTMDLLLVALIGSAIISAARFLLGTHRLNHALAIAVPLAKTPYQRVDERLQELDHTQYGALPPIFVVDLPIYLAFATGLFHSRIYISTTLLHELSVDEAVAVLCHEWAHIRRRDIQWNWVIRMFRDMLWFLPTSYLAWSAMMLSQDEACDVLAARMTRQPLVLARALVKVASSRKNIAIQRLTTASLFAQAGSAPRVRVEQMIALNNPASPKNRLPTLGAMMLGFLLLVLSVLPALLGS